VAAFKETGNGPSCRQRGWIGQKLLLLGIKNPIDSGYVVVPRPRKKKRSSRSIIRASMETLPTATWSPGQPVGFHVFQKTTHVSRRRTMYRLFGFKRKKKKTRQTPPAFTTDKQSSIRPQRESIYISSIELGFFYIPHRPSSIRRYNYYSTGWHLRCNVVKKA